MSTAPSLSIGTLLAGRWIVGAPLGVGESGAVYEAEETTGGRHCAVKVLNADLSRAGQAWNAFQQEVRNVSALAPDGIARIYDLGFEAKLHRAFIVGERVMFPSLSRGVTERGPLPVVALSHALASIGSAIDAMHTAGIAHGGLRPQNVFISTENPAWARITDYGLVRLKLALTPMKAATLGWCAPEAARGQPPTPGGDIYGLGLIAFFALTGMPWFTAFGVNASEGAYAPPTVPASVRAKELGGTLDPIFDPWFRAALAIEPAARYANVGEMANALFAIVGASTPAAEPPHSGPGVASAYAQPLVFLRDGGKLGGFEPVPSRRPVDPKSVAGAGLAYSPTARGMPALDQQGNPQNPGNQARPPLEGPPLSATLPIGAMGPNFAAFQQHAVAQQPTPQQPMQQHPGHVQQPMQQPPADPYAQQAPQGYADPYAQQAPQGYADPYAQQAPQGYAEPQQGYGAQQGQYAQGAYAPPTDSHAAYAPATGAPGTPSSPKKAVMLLVILGVLGIGGVAGAIVFMRKGSDATAAASGSAPTAGSAAPATTAATPAASGEAIPPPPPEAPVPPPPAPEATQEPLVPPLPPKGAIPPRPAAPAPQKPAPVAAKPAPAKPTTTPAKTQPATTAKPGPKPSSKKCGTFINPCK